MPGDDPDPTLPVDVAFKARHPYGVRSPAPPPVRDRDDELLPYPPDGRRDRSVAAAAGSGARRLLVALVVLFAVGGLAVVL